MNGLAGVIHKTHGFRNGYARSRHSGYDRDPRAVEAEMRHPRFFKEGVPHFCGHAREGAGYRGFTLYELLEEWNQARMQDSCEDPSALTLAFRAESHQTPLDVYIADWDARFAEATALMYPDFE